MDAHKEYLAKLETERFTSPEHYVMLAKHYERKKLLSEARGNIDQIVAEVQADSRRKFYQKLRENLHNDSKHETIRLAPQGGSLLTEEQQLAIALRSLENKENK